MATMAETPWHWSKTWAVLLILSQLIGTSTAGVTISVLFQTFRNPTEHDYIGQCCDPFCHQQCDHYFHICMDSLARPPSPIDTHDQDACHYFKRTTNMFDEENRNEFDHDMHGIQNPIVLHKPKWEGLAFKVIVMDRDSHSGPDLVDRFYYEFAEKPMSHKLTRRPLSNQRVLRGLRPRDKTSLAVRFDIQCEEDFFGDTCERKCRSREDALGHFTCDDEGRKVCNPGWQGIDRNCTLPCPPGLIDEAGCSERAVSSGQTAAGNMVTIIGIVVGLLVLLIIIIVIVVAILWSRHRREKEKKDQGVSATVTAVTVEQQTPTSTGVGTTGGAASDAFQDNKMNAGLEARSGNMMSQTPGHAFVQTQSNSNAFSQTPSHAHTQTRAHGNAYAEVGNGVRNGRGMTSAGVQAGGGPPPYTASVDDNNPLFKSGSVKDMASMYEEPIKMKL